VIVAVGIFVYLSFKLNWNLFFQSVKLKDKWLYTARDSKIGFGYAFPQK